MAITLKHCQHRKKMKFQFKNLGAIDQAEVELADLTLICGENNTGKTYVTYAIHALLVAWRQMIGWQIDEADMQRLLNLGAVAIDMQKSFIDKWPQIHQHTCENWRSTLHYALSAPSERFKHTQLAFEPGIDDRWKKTAYSSELRSEQGRIIFSIKKPPDSAIIEIAALQDGDEAHDAAAYHSLRDFIREDLLEAVLASTLPPIFMVSAERTGAVAFNEEINLTRSRLLNVLANVGPDVNSIYRNKLLEAVSRRMHATPIENNLQFINQISSLEGRTGVLMTQHPDISVAFDALAGGRFEIRSHGIVHFIPSNTDIRLELSEASSSVRSLFILWSWLKAQASPGNMLLIDEPEMNLHPRSQRRLARLVARLIHAGLKVFITTHSDYLVKELNTLIMLAQQTTHTRAIQQKFYYSDQELLDPNRVRLYMAGIKLEKPAKRVKKHPMRTLWPATIHPDRGIEVTTFDTTIEEMNGIQGEILYGGEL
jgi:predicted ATPase